MYKKAFSVCPQTLLAVQTMKKNVIYKVANKPEVSTLCPFL